MCRCCNKLQSILCPVEPTSCNRPDRSKTLRRPLPAGTPHVLHPWQPGFGRPQHHQSTWLTKAMTHPLPYRLRFAGMGQRHCTQQTAAMTRSPTQLARQRLLLCRTVEEDVPILKQTFNTVLAEMGIQGAGAIDDLVAEICRCSSHGTHVVVAPRGTASRRLEALLHMGLRPWLHSLHAPSQSAGLEWPGSEDQVCADLVRCRGLKRWAWCSKLHRSMGTCQTQASVVNRGSHLFA